MRVVRRVAARTLLTVGLLSCAALLGACAQKPPPTLTTPLADQARDVPVDDVLAVTTTGAVLDHVTLQRLDGPESAPSFAVEETRAQLARARFRPTHATGSSLRRTPSPRRRARRGRRPSRSP